MLPAEKQALKKKLKSELGHVRSATERIFEVNRGRISSESKQQSLLVGESNRGVTSSKQPRQSERDKMPKNAESCESKVKAAAMPSSCSKKRLSRMMQDVSLPEGKKIKLDSCVIEQQCSTLLKNLMNHPAGWVFSHPIDPVALNIPDYFSILSKSMDLGTIKSKLQKKLYLSTQEFAADVRLTFSNAILYIPPSNNVHVMAKQLYSAFNLRWKSLEAKWGGQSTKVNEKQKKKAPNIVRGFQRRSTLHVNPSGGRGVTKSCGHESLNKGINKGNDTTRHSGDSASFQLPMNSGAYASDIDSVRSSSRDNRAFHDGVLKQGCVTNDRKNTRMSKPDPGSEGEGAVSSVDEEDVQPMISQLTTATATVTTVAASGEGSKEDPLYDVQTSPSKALHAALLKSRFADTILKAQQWTLLNHGKKADPTKMQQQEKERLESKQREEKASRLRAEAEKKMQRQREREAARIALQKMEKTVDINENQEILKDLEMFFGYSQTNQLNNEALGGRNGNVLERLGLFMKDDYMEEEEAVLNGDVEEGEIVS
ncbi:hypothetical protein NE237_004024 [Protea cynaroides]|uniref:Bromo domain-containing protein n=1 Tax=Protea cynaroides TaxID=273540 RepID=A0A9Q0KI71_9MAGN|nr:hypothetical protein NE237_004024 [Protea cynaroides]